MMIITRTAIVNDGEFPIEQTFTVNVENTCKWNKRWFFQTGQWMKCNTAGMRPSFY